MQCLCTRSLCEISCTSSLEEFSWQDLWKRSLGKISATDLYAMSLYKISKRGVLARSLYKISIRGLLARSLYKLPLGKISVWDVSFCASLRSRNAHGYFTRAILHGNLQGKCRTRRIPPRFKHWALTLTVRTAHCGHTVWGKRVFSGHDVSGKKLQCLVSRP